MKEMSRIEHMLVSRRGALWKEICVAAFTVHIDDSGTDPCQKVAIASALIIPADRIVPLEGEWNKLKETEEFKCFHMSEFAARNPKSEFAGWSDEKQARVVKRVRQIVRKYNVKAFSFGVLKHDYDEVIPNHLRVFTGKYHYSWAVRTVLAFIRDWAAISNVVEPLEYIFDFMGEESASNRKEVEDILAQAEEESARSGRPGMYTHYDLNRKRCELAGLQCADVLAWTCYTQARWAYLQTPLTKLAIDCWEEFRMFRSETWLYAASIQRVHLEEWVARELKDGRSVERFRAWEKTREERRAEREKAKKQRVRKI